MAKKKASTRKTPGAKKPGAKKPGAKRPGAKKPGAKKPGAKVARSDKTSAIDSFDLERQTGWTLGQGEFSGKPTLVRCRQDLDLFVGHARWPRRLTVTWPYPTDDPSGMPSSEVIDTMQVFEDAVVPALERDKAAILTVVFTHDGARHWHFYFGDAGLLQARINEALDGLAVFPIQLSAEDDPGWDEYRAALAGGT